jgi:hypothetical protein
VIGEDAPLGVPGARPGTAVGAPPEASTDVTARGMTLDIPPPAGVAEASPSVPEAPASDGVADASPLDPAIPAASTLIVERVGRPEGVALGIGELQRLSVGEATTFGGHRPAIRAVAGTGPLILAFDDVTSRDRAAAELVGEAGLDLALSPGDPEQED